MFKDYSKSNLVHKFNKAPELEIELRLPNASDEVALERFLRKDPVMFEALVYQLALVLVSTNLVSVTGEPLVNSEMSFGERVMALYELPAEMISEASEALAVFYPAWKLTE